MKMVILGLAAGLVLARPGVAQPAQDGGTAAVKKAHTKRAPARAKPKVEPAEADRSKSSTGSAAKTAQEPGDPGQPGGTPGEKDPGK